MNNPGARAALRGFASVLLGTVGLTVVWLAPDIPKDIIVAWGAVFMGGFGAVEAIVDARRKPLVTAAQVREWGAPFEEAVRRAAEERQG